MAGLIDFDREFRQEVCIIEWAERMPASIMQLPRAQTVEVAISGVGVQAAGEAGLWEGGISWDGENAF